MQTIRKIENNRKMKTAKNTQFPITIIAAALVLSSCGEQNEKTERAPERVKTTVVSSATAQMGRTFSGTIEEVAGSQLSFSGMGTVETIEVSEGQTVRAGQVLATLDGVSTNNSLISAKATTKQAKDQLSQAEDAYSRYKQLHDAGSLPEIKWIEIETKLSQARSAVEQAEAIERIAEKNADDNSLCAPYNGYIAAKNIEVGQNAVVGMNAFKIVKIDQVKVKISVPEKEIAQVKIGQDISVVVSALGDKKYTARVTEKGVQANALSRSYEVKAVIDNKDLTLLPGMVCDAYISESSGDEVITLPANIIQIDSNNKRFVWTVNTDRAEKRYVETGANMGDNVVIESGLSNGDEVIVVGQQKVSSGMKVTRI